MKKSTLSLIASIVFLIATVVSFVWIWFNLSGEESDDFDAFNTSVNYQSINVSSIGEKAKDLVTSMQNITPIPIPKPIDKLGKENPFSE